MLAAISTTILSNRSWAETCSAMVSRSRLSKTRGPPDALRMCQYPPPRGQRTGWPAAGGKFTKNNSFIHSAPPQAGYRPNQDRQNCGTVCGSSPIRPYSELRLVLPSKTPATRPSSNAATAKRARSAKPLAVWRSDDAQKIIFLEQNSSGAFWSDACTACDPRPGTVRIHKTRQTKKNKASIPIRSEPPTFYLSSLIEPIERVQRTHRKFSIGGVDEYRKLDFGGGDGTDVDIARGQGGERLGGDTGMAAHATADHRNLRNVRGAVEPDIADRGLGRGDGIAGAGIVRGWNGESKVGSSAVLRDVLHDHVDIDIGFCQRAEDRRGDARLVLDLADGNLGFVLGKGDAGDNVAFHDLLLAADQRTRRCAVRVDILGFVEAGTDEHRHVVHHAEFHRADLQPLGTLRGQFQHILERDLVEPARLGNHARVGGIDAIDIGIDIAAVGLDRGGDRHRRGVGTAASQRGDSPGLRIDALEAGDHGDFLAVLEAVDQLGAVDLENPRRRVGVAGLDRDLPTLPGTCVNADRLQRDREQPRGNLFAGRHHGVIFAPVVHR